MRCEGAPYSHAIGLAISRDGGITFQRYAEGPLLARTPAEFFLAEQPYRRHSAWEIPYVVQLGIRWFMHEGRPSRYTYDACDIG